MKKGFTVVEVFIVLAVIGLLAAIAIPSFLRAKEQADLNRKLNNNVVMDRREKEEIFEKKFDITLLFEYNGVKVYSFRNNGNLASFSTCDKCSHNIDKPILEKE